MVGVPDWRANLPSLTYGPKFALREDIWLVEREKAWGVSVRGLHLAGLGVVPITAAHVPLARTQSHDSIQLQGKTGK